MSVWTTSTSGLETALGAIGQQKALNSNYGGAVAGSFVNFHNNNNNGNKENQNSNTCSSGSGSGSGSNFSLKQQQHLNHHTSLPNQISATIVAGAASVASGGVGGSPSNAYNHNNNNNWQRHSVSTSVPLYTTSNPKVSDIFVL